MGSTINVKKENARRTVYIIEKNIYLFKKKSGFLIT